MIKKFNISVEMEDRWVDCFCSMLKEMERLGDIGSSKIISIYSDGDGDFRPKFTIEEDYKTVQPNIKTNSNDIKVYDAG